MLAVVAVLLAPVYLTSRGFGPDWTVHLWAMWVQGAHIAEGAGPRLFLDGGFLGVFFPHYAFYGGTLYTIGGGLSALLGGNALLAYALMWTLSFCMAYGGLLWLSLQAGLGGWRAHAAPLVLVTSAYYLTNAYARGVWPELTATSSLMMVLAAGVHLLRAERLRPLPCAAFLGATVILTGSHNITLVWSTITLTALAVVGLVALPRHGREIGIRRIASVAGLAVVAVGVNAWFLIPNLAYATRTRIVDFGGHPDHLVSDWFDAPGNLLSLLRRTPPESGTPDLFVQLPVLILAWVIVAGGIALTRPLSPAWRRFVVGTGAMIAALLTMLMTNRPWDWLPEFLGYLQFTFRLETYILLCLALLLIALLVWLEHRASRRARHAAETVLAGALLVGAVSAVWQVWHAPSQGDRGAALTAVTELPPTWYDPGLFRDQSLPIVPGSTDAFQVVVSPDAGARDRTVTVAAPPGVADVTTNIATGPYLVDVEGAEPIGVSPSGWLVLRRPADEVGRNTIELRLSTADSGPVVAGRWVTRVTLAGVAAAVLLLTVGQPLRRRLRTEPTPS